jgi:hypothetical protein
VVTVKGKKVSYKRVAKAGAADEGDVLAKAAEDSAFGQLEVQTGPSLPVVLRRKYLRLPPARRTRAKAQ